MNNILSIDADTKKIAGSFFVNRNLKYVINYDSICFLDYYTYLKKWCKIHKVQKIYIEDQDFYRFDTAKDIKKLMIHVGILSGGLCEYQKNFEFVKRVSPLAWKGNTKKHIIKERILNELTTKEKKILVFSKKINKIREVKKLNNDCMDSIGIGLYKLERL